MRIFFVLAFFFAVQICSAQSFFSIADSVRKARGIPAIAYAVFTDHSIIDVGASGFRKYHARDSVRITDRFQLGTNSFAFVTWVAGKLVETGKIKWTTTFNSLFPDYAKKISPQFANLDLRTLLSNTGSIQPYKQFDDYAHIPLFNGDEQAQRREFSAWVLQRPGMSDAREEKMVESIAGYTIAVAMLEKASGQSYDKLIEAYINKPLGISVKFGWPNTVSPQEPWGHWSRYGGLAGEPADTWVKLYPAVVATSGANINVRDYAHFLQNELKGLRGGKAYLTQPTLELIHFGNPYPLGWENPTSSVKTATHSGDSYLFNSYVILIPEKNIGVLAVCNDGDSSGKGAVIHLARLITDSLLSK